MKHLNSFIIIIVFNFFIVNISYAQSDDEARIHFEAARSYYQHGQFEEALREFQTAYQLSPRPLLLYNIGMCNRELGRWQESISAFEQYLQELPNATDADVVRRRIEQMRQFLNNNQTKNQDANNNQTQQTKNQTVESNQNQQQTKNQTTEENSNTNQNETKVSYPTNTEVTSTANVSFSSNKTMKLIGWITAGLGAGMLIGSAITGGLALGVQGDLDSCSDSEGTYDPAASGCNLTKNQFNDEVGNLSNLSTTTDVLIGIGAGFAVAGTILLLINYLGTDSSETQNSDTSFIIMPSSNGIGFTVNY